MSDANPSTGARRQAGFGFIFGSALMNSISFGVMIPILPILIKQFTGGDTATAADWNVLFASVWGVMQIISSPILGLLSDRVGRRPVMLISIFGLACDFVLIAFAPNLMWLFVGRVLNGMTASSFSTANAYLADVTPADQRAKAFGMLASAFSFGFIVGPALGGWLGEISLRLPFLAAAAISFANWLYGLLILPESLPPERRISRFEWRRANPLGSLTLLRSQPGLLALAAVGFLHQLGHMVMPSIFVLYANYRYHWSPSQMGTIFVLSGVAGVLVQSLLVGPVVKRIGERNSVLLGALCGALGLAWYATAWSGSLYMLGVPVFACMGFLQPGLLGLMSRRLPPHQQGQLQGANQALIGIASIVGPPLYGLSFAWAVRNAATVDLPGLPVYMAAVLYVLALALALGVAHAHRENAAAVPA